MFIDLGRYHHNPLLEHFCHSPKFPSAHLQLFPSPAPSQVVSDLPLIKDLPFLDMWLLGFSDFVPQCLAPCSANMDYRSSYLYKIKILLHFMYVWTYLQITRVLSVIRTSQSLLPNISHICLSRPDLSADLLIQALITRPDSLLISLCHFHFSSIPSCELMSE